MRNHNAVKSCSEVSISIFTGLIENIGVHIQFLYIYIYIFAIKDSDVHNDVCEGSVEIFGVIIMIPVTIYLLWIFPLSLRLSESD